MNRRGSNADIAIVVLVVMLFSAALISKDPTIRATATIGKYQNELMDSYVIAENSRSYIEHSYVYAVRSALSTSDYCQDSSQKELFLSELEAQIFVNTQNLPKESNGFMISAPFTSTIVGVSEFYDMDDAISLYTYGGDRILTISVEPIHLTNSNQNFKINTSVKLNLEYNLEEVCDEQELFSSLIAEFEDRVLD